MDRPSSDSAKSREPEVCALAEREPDSDWPHCWANDCCEVCADTSPPVKVRPTSLSDEDNIDILASIACLVSTAAAAKSTWAESPSSEIFTLMGPISAGLRCNSAVIGPSDRAELTHMLTFSASA